jgi:mannan endo-1,6-alpha-mannosidase
MTAAERQFPNPPSGNPTWQDLAVNVFNDQVARWDAETCNGGLRWQIFTFNNGYNYKNAMSNAWFFALAARLSRSTGNQTYADWAEKTYSWLEQAGLLDTSNGAVYDGTDVTLNCTQINHIQWTANAGAVLYGSAVMYNATSNSTWSSRISTVLNETLTTFFQNGIMVEVACEPGNNCDTDQTFFKGLLARDLARTAQLAPFTAASISPLLQSSAKGAAAACDSSGTNCGFVWTSGGKSANAAPVGPQFNALEVVQANLVPSSKAPSGNSTGTPTGGSSPTSKSSANQLLGSGYMIFAVAGLSLLLII